MYYILSIMQQIRLLKLFLKIKLSIVTYEETWHVRSISPMIHKCCSDGHYAYTGVRNIGADIQRQKSTRKKTNHHDTQSYFEGNYNLYKFQDKEHFQDTKALHVTGVNVILHSGQLDLQMC